MRLLERKTTITELLAAHQHVEILRDRMAEASVVMPILSQYVAEYGRHWTA